MKLDDAIKVVRQLQRYGDYKCTRRSRRGYYVRNFLIKRCTKAELKQAINATDRETLRHRREVWVDLDKLKAEQVCLAPRRLLYQLRRVPLKKRPTVIKLKDGTHLLWDGNHRVTAHLLLGRRRIKCIEIRKAS